LNVLDLFSGIGGFSLGLERAGMRTVAFCEQDAYCTRVLNRHWPTVPVYPDVRTIPHIGGIDLVCGGFPCQPWSHAGQQLGAEDDRHLWPAMREVIRRERPAYVVGENVIGLVNLGLDAVLSDLEEDAYAVRTFDIPACAVDAPHIRRRVWIVACDTHRDRQPDVSVDAEVARLRSTHGDAADAHGSRLQGRDERAERTGERSAGEGLRERHWPSPDAWIHRVDDGVPARAHRLRALGNSVVPAIIEEIGRAIMLTDEATVTL
jgi:DNA (cytosine-5)-methyltransferase 1